MPENRLSNQPKNAEDFLPLHQGAAYILLSLAERPQHGYGIMKRVQELSGGSVDFSGGNIGNIYTQLQRYLGWGLVSRGSEIDDPRNRKDYALTPFGREVLEAEFARISQLRFAMGSVLRQ